MPLRSHDGVVTGHIAAVEDISLRSRLYAKLTALIETSRILLDTPRLGAVLPAAVQVARTLIAADGYALWRLNDGGDWRVVESNGVSPAFAAAVVPADGSSFTRFDVPLAVNDVGATAALANRHAAYATEGVRALLAVPLQIRGGWSGSLVFYYRSEQHFDHIRMETAAALGNLCAVAISTAELYEEQLAQRERLERAHRQSSFLARAGVILGSSLDYAATLKAVAELAVPDVADWCAVDIADDDGRLQRLGTAHVDPAKLEFARTLRERFPEEAEAPGTPSHVFRTRQPVVISGITDAMLQQGARGPAHLDALRTLQLHSYISVPLIANGRALGVITFVTAESQRTYDADDVLVAQAVAERAALAVDNARAYGEARAANRAKDEFLATLSHELRTPINAIMGWGKILQAGIVDPARTAHAIDAIVRNAAAQARLIEDLLDLSRIISGKLRLDVELVDLASVVSSAVLTIEPASQVKGLRVQTVIEDGTARVFGDRQRLQQAVWNLLSNAVKFTPRGGSVQTHLRRVGSQLEIMVSDTGEGIRPEVLPFVFDRFRQADSSSTRQHAGLGLGLAIVRHIVELHGGTVHAASEGLDRGATFRIRLPISVAAAEPAASAQVHPAAPAITTGSLAVDALPDLAGTCDPRRRGRRRRARDGELPAPAAACGRGGLRVRRRGLARIRSPPARRRVERHRDAAPGRLRADHDAAGAARGPWRRRPGRGADRLLAPRGSRRVDDGRLRRAPLQAGRSARADRDRGPAARAAPIATRAATAAAAISQLVLPRFGSRLAPVWPEPVGLGHEVHNGRAIRRAISRRPRSTERPRLHGTCG